MGVPDNFGVQAITSALLPPLLASFPPLILEGILQSKSKDPHFTDGESEPEKVPKYAGFTQRAGCEHRQNSYVHLFPLGHISSGDAVSKKERLREEILDSYILSLLCWL